MNGTRIPIDGLWRCLCPSIDAIVQAKTFESPLSSRSTRWASSIRRVRKTFPACRVRALHQTGPTRASLAVKHPDEGAEAPGSRECGLGIPSPASTDGYDASITVADLVRSQGAHRELLRAPTPVILEAIGELQHKSGQTKKIKKFVDHLVEVRKETLTAELCNALLAGQCGRPGSADEIRDTMKRMADAHVEKTPTTFRNALWGLAAHPDYLCRNSILKEMKRHWVDIDDSAKQAVALGLLRDGQHELAAEKMEEMVHAGSSIPTWLWEIFIYKYCQLGFLNEAVALMEQRLNLAQDIEDIPLNPWYFLLDECSKGMHYEGTKFIWNRLVLTGTLNPSDGIVLNVLNTASRVCDATLATEAIRHLSARGVKLGLHHYEALLDSYALADDMENALQVLCIMAKASIRPVQASTRTLLPCLKKSATLTTKAAELLFQLRKDHEIPIAAMNVVLEAYSEQGNISGAVSLYRSVRDLCNAGPETYTFEVLLSRPVDASLADFLASEMSAFSIKPTPQIFDALIQSYTRIGHLDIAFNYVRQLSGVLAKSRKSKTAASWLSKSTLDALIRRCFEAEDTRLWNLVNEARHRGIELEADLKRILDDFRKGKEETERGRGGSRPLLQAAKN